MPILPTSRRSFCSFLAAVAAAPILVLPATAEATDLSGHWEGRWASLGTGHQGPLKGDFVRLSATQYQVNFRGRFFKIFPFKYSVVLNVVSEGANFAQLRGSSYLGRMFGTFHYNATVQGNCFSATYTSCKDNGTFKMTKCC